MVALVRVIAQLTPWFYAILAVVALLSLRMIQLAQRDWRQSLFSLEREAARNRFYRSIALLAGIVVLAGLVFAFGRYVTPLVDKTPTGTPTATGLLGPTPTVRPSVATPVPSATLFMTPTRHPATPVPTALAAATIPVVPTAAPPACPNAQARITSPGDGARLAGSVQINGTAAVSGFSFFKIEIGIGGRPQSWSAIGDLRRTAVTDGALGVLDTTAFPPGEYTLRLVVVDQTGNFPEPCEVHITIVR